MGENTKVLEISELTKDFGAGKGIFDIGLSVQPGEIIGFVGPNGSGKSTTINAITGLIKPDSGDFALFGKEMSQTKVHTVFRRIGVMYSEPTLESNKTARQIFERTQNLFGKDCSKSWQKMSDLFGLDLDKKVKKLSLGNKKKVEVIKTLMHEPELIIMDEPTSGLDPIIKDTFLGLIQEAAQRGAAVLLSSHDLTEVQHVSSRIIMIKSGHIILDDATTNILDKSLRLFRLIEPPVSLVQKLKALDYIHELHAEGSDQILHTTGYESLVKLLGESKFYNYFIEQPSLEDTFKEKYE